jgi:hypothetical protein
MHTRRVLTCFALAGATTALAACGFNPLGGATPSSTTGTVSKATTQSTVPTPTTPVQPTSFAKSPAPSTFDPLLASGSWGYFDDSSTDIRKHVDDDTLAFHDVLEKDEVDDLTVNQYYALLKIFKHSAKIHRAIRAAGGDYDDAAYRVLAIQASDDVGIDTPWVYATLVAVFPTSDGIKEIQCDVYRLKTQKGLDERPFVSGTLVGYVDSGGAMMNPKQVRIH